MNKISRSLLTLFLASLLLVLICFFALYERGFYSVDHSVEPKPGQIRVACVGDSITFGLGTTHWPYNTYPAVLQRLLGSGYHVENFGISGYAVQESADMSYRGQPEYQESLDYGADIVVFMMGSNDTKALNWNGAEAFRSSLLSFLDSYSNSEIFLCTVCSMFFDEREVSGNVYALRPSVAAEVSEVIRDVAFERGYPLIDIYEFSSTHPEWFADGVHPDNAGTAAIAREIFAAIGNTLS